MFRLIRSASLRAKFIIIVSVAMTVLLASVLFVAVTIFIQDKSAYVMDYNLIQVRSVANAVDSQIQKIVQLTRLMHFQTLNHDKKVIEQVFIKNKTQFRLKRLVVLNLSKGNVLVPYTALADDDKILFHSLAQLGWDAIRFLNDTTLIGKSPVSGDLTVGLLVRDPNGEGMIYVYLLSPDFNLPAFTSEFQIFLVDPIGDVVFSTVKQSQSENRPHIIKILKSIFDGKGSSGMTRWNLSSDNVFVSYQRLFFKELTVIGLISEKVAFATVHTLLTKAIALGVSIIFVTLGMIILFSMQLTARFQTLIQASKKIFDAEFNYRLEVQDSEDDEMGLLLRSFNALNVNLENITGEAIQKRVKDLDLEVASIVSTRSLLSDSLVTPNFQLCGKSVFSRQFSGDWWYYKELGDSLICGIGKANVTGISALAVVSVATSVLSTFCLIWEESKGQPPSLVNLMNILNQSLFELGGGKRQMNGTFFLLNKRTGSMQLVSAGHASPILHHLEFENRPDRVSDRFKSLGLRKQASLGLQKDSHYTPEPLRLEPGDMLFQNTAGLYQPFLDGIKSFNISEIQSYLAESYDNSGNQAKVISRDLHEKLEEFLGKESGDDRTVVILTVSQTANFEIEK